MLRREPHCGGTRFRVCYRRALRPFLSDASTGQPGYSPCPAPAARSSTTIRMSPSRRPTGRRFPVTSISRSSTRTLARRTRSSRGCKASIDVAAANERGVVVCGTPAVGSPTAAIAIGLMLELTRRIGYENARMKAGAPWQTTIGMDLEGLTLGVLGLGKLGTRTAKIAQAFGMKVIAWSQNLTAEKCKEVGVDYVSKEELFRQADFVTIHVVLSQRTRGLVGAKELALMKPSAYIINTSRGPIIEEAPLLAALRGNKIAGAGLDVFDVEPLPVDHPLRKMDNVVPTPHLGYVAMQNYRAYFGGVVDDIRAFLDGKPVRVIA